MSDTQMTTKSVLRKKLYSIINDIPKCEILRQSEIVTSKVLNNVEFQNAKVVSIYLSMSNEIQTEKLVNEIFKERKECFVPRFQAGNPIMEMIRLSSLEQYYQLPKNKWNIKQLPATEKGESIFDRGILDLVITPGLGFTTKGHRLGRGMGYYDRFFKKCQNEFSRFPYTMGLAFNEQILPNIPTEEHDFSLDLIVAPVLNECE